MLDSLITSKTRLRLLVKFFMNVANEGHLRGLATEFNESTNSIRKELNNLSEAGYLEKENVQNRVLYKANSKHPLFGSLQKIVRTYIGLDAITAQVLERMGSVDKIIVTGDYANGIDSGIISITLVGKSLNKEYVEHLSAKIEGIINRKVVFSLSENEVEGLQVFQA
ncbi:ArsR family transcriptional regulator [Flavobacterium ardleyense]|uniref:ArsR family transcriptional regulator n=1 Tax=Flavobacterium ardleyense TaxID=2038737 RepID=UPI00298C5BCD|nr:ArsR family transcriptional regulator [Flavobacterium ardleyense]